MKKKRRIFSFTLVEVIVSMAVFAILMLGLMQFFSSAQGLWTSTSNQVSTYEEARTAMNMIATDLMCAYYEEGRTVTVGGGEVEDHRYFFIVQDPENTYPPALNSGRFKGLAFATLRQARAHEDAVTRLTEVFYRKRGNHLEMLEIADNLQDVVREKGLNWKWVTDSTNDLPEPDRKFTTINASEEEGKRFPFYQLTNKVGNSGAPNNDTPVTADIFDGKWPEKSTKPAWSTIAKNVVRFSVKVFRPYGGAMQFSEMFNPSASNVTKMPDMVVLRLLMIDPQTAKEIKELDPDCIYEDHLETQVSRSGLLYDSDEVVADGADGTENRIRELLRKNMIVVTRAVTLTHEF